MRSPTALPCRNFNPRSPHGERPGGVRRLQAAGDFNPRSPHGERRIRSTILAIWRISIHAPRTGSDKRLDDSCIQRRSFQSTLPARGATERVLDMPRCADISIHAPRTGSDARLEFTAAGFAGFQSTLPARGATWVTALSWKTTRYFNPRSPHGERPCYAVHGGLARHNFNPRSPHGERRAGCSDSQCPCHFNPRSPHGERRAVVCFRSLSNSHFNPRSPHGERPVRVGHLFRRDAISIHAPRTGSDTPCGHHGGRNQTISIHAPRTGSDA